jgi:hypothetical protein
MEPEGLLPCSRGPAAVPYPEPGECSPHRRPVFKINFNIILQSTAVSHVLNAAVGFIYCKRCLKWMRIYD